MSVVTASIIIDNYNYARYLREAIDSALGQTHAAAEVIVVDDGSADGSRDIIASYGERIVPVLKDNGGQGSAFNAGFARSRGNIIVFLDADDALLPSALAQALPLFDDPETVKVHWPMWLTDSSGRRSGQTYPGAKLASGDLRKYVLREGPTHHMSAPTSGNAWRRSFVAEVLPLPEHTYRTAADTPLIEMAPFFGKLGFVETPQSIYRQHDSNLHNAFSIERLIANEISFYEHYTAELSRRLPGTVRDLELTRWRANSWWYLQAAAVADIGTLPQPGRPIVLVDDATWEPGLIHGRRRIPFIERNGQYGGPPADDAAAICELERLRAHADAPSHIVFAWGSFWWLDTFAEFVEYLEKTYARVLDSPRVIAYDVRRERAAETQA